MQPVEIAVVVLTTAWLLWRTKDRWVRAGAAIVGAGYVGQVLLFMILFGG